MIPKTIHYCWFGRNPKPKLAKRCINSWKKYCPDYRIVEWDENNFDISSCPLYVRQAYEAEKWAFVTDYVRLKVVHDFGGIYLDTDVELLKNLDFLLANKAFFGFEEGRSVATGLGFGAEKGTPLLQSLMDEYNDIPFILPDGSFDKTTCPVRNTNVFLKHGLVQNDRMQFLDDGIRILPKEYLSPRDYFTEENHITPNTVSIHWFAASWKTKQEKNLKKQLKKEKTYDMVMHFPNYIAKRILGEEKYYHLKSVIKGEKCQK